MCNSWATQSDTCQTKSLYLPARGKLLDGQALEIHIGFETHNHYLQNITKKGEPKASLGQNDLLPKIKALRELSVIIDSSVNFAAPSISQQFRKKVLLGFVARRPESLSTCNSFFRNHPIEVKSP